MNRTVSDAWTNWRPEHATVCDTCRLPVAPISVGWAVVIDNPEGERRWRNTPAHTCTVNGEAH